MPRTIIFSVGIPIPHPDVEFVQLTQRQSLLDADLVIFCPHYWDFPTTENFEGRPCFGKSPSFAVRDVHAHWKHQLQLAVEAGRVIIVLLLEIDERFAYTGKHEFSGTGRNQKVTNIVEAVSNLNMCHFLLQKSRIPAERELYLKKILNRSKSIMV